MSTAESAVESSERQAELTRTEQLIVWIEKAGFVRESTCEVWFRPPRSDGVRPCIGLSDLIDASDKYYEQWEAQEASVQKMRGVLAIRDAT